MKYFLTCLSSEIRNLKNLIYFLFFMGNAVCVSTCVSVETHTLSVWVQTDLDATPHVPEPSNRFHFPVPTAAHFSSSICSTMFV